MRVESQGFCMLGCSEIGSTKLLVSISLGRMQLSGVDASIATK